MDARLARHEPDQQLAFAHSAAAVDWDESAARAFPSLLERCQFFSAADEGCAHGQTQIWTRLT